MPNHQTQTVRSTLGAALAVAVGTLAWTTGTAAAPAPAQVQEAAAPQVEEVSVRVGPGAAELTAELSDGSRTSVALEGGDVLVDGEARASYSAGGELEAAWRDFLRTRVQPDAAALASSLRAWSPPSGADPGAARALTGAVERMATIAARGEAAADAADRPARDAAPPVDTTELTDGETRVVPSGRPLEELRASLDRLRRSLQELGRGAAATVGDASLVVHDDYEIDAGRTVDGTVALLSGTLTVSGDVEGDVLVLDGDLILEEGSTVAGDVLQMGGAVTNRGGRIDGDLVSIGGDEPITRRTTEPDREYGADEEPDFDEDDFGPGYGDERPSRGFGAVVLDNLEDGFRMLSLTLSFFIVAAVFGAVPLYFAREEFETATATVRNSFGRSFLLGLAGQVLFFPALVVLAVGVLTIPLIPVLMLAVALALAGGYVAAGNAVGHVIRERGYDWLRRLGAGPYRTLLLGLAALQVLYLVVSFLDFFGGVTGPLYGLAWFAATTVTWIAFTAGFGAVALSYAGTRDDYAGPGGPGGGAEPPAAAGGGEPPPAPATGGPVRREQPASGTERAPREDRPGSGDEPGDTAEPAGEEDRPRRGGRGEPAAGEEPSDEGEPADGEERRE